MKIPFENVSINKTSQKLIVDSLDRKRISSGILVHRLECALSDLMHIKNSVAVNSYSTAQLLTCLLLYDFGAKRGDEIILPALSPISLGNAVIYAGFTPVFIDIDPQTLNIDINLIEKAITKNTRAIISVHTMGKPVLMDEIKTIAKKQHIIIIEDCSQAWGATYKNQIVGSLADLGIFSLNPTNLVTTTYDGGIITTNKEYFIDILHSLRNNGNTCTCKICSAQKKEEVKKVNIHDDSFFTCERLGFSSKMNDLEASLCIASLENYEKNLKVRHENLLTFIKGFEEFEEFFTVYSEESHETLGTYAFPFTLKERAPFFRDELFAYLQQEQIEARILSTSLPTQCNHYKFLEYKFGDFPHSEYVGKQGMQLPIHQEINPKNIQYVLNVIRAFLELKA